MWQVLLAAAVAGSGLFVKRLRSTNSPEPIIIVPQKCDPPNDPDNSSSNAPLSSSPPNDCFSYATETKGSKFFEESVFRFSTASGSPRGNGAKNLRKKLGHGSRGGKRNVVRGIEKFEKNCCPLNNGGEGLVTDQRKNLRKFTLSLKKRRISKNACAKCQSFASKDESSFAWGLGVGLMYVMSAGKAEISRLNTAMDETAKVVEKLKTEIAKRKSPRTADVLNLGAEGNANQKNGGDEYCFPVSDDAECGSSILTEEHPPEVLEMNQLVAELESELQKLPGCTTEDTGPERSSVFYENEVSAEEFNGLDRPNLKSFEHNGVMASELDQKLCHVLIEQQESHIVELESKLQRSCSKLNEKEAELQTLKDCVRRLTKFSLGSASDEETEAQGNEKETSYWVHDHEMGAESKSVVGMKRAVDYNESYGCCTK